jgi:hypothetical protein
VLPKELAECIIVQFKTGNLITERGREIDTPTVLGGDAFAKTVVIPIGAEDGFVYYVRVQGRMGLCIAIRG